MSDWNSERPEIKIDIKISPVRKCALDLFLSKQEYRLK